MKILHTADWHLGKKLALYSRLAEQKEVLQEICDLADTHQVDVVLVAGDLFDAFNPPTEAVELLYLTLKQLTKNGTRPVIAIAGNHDSPDRIDAPDPLAKACGILFVGNPNAEITNSEAELGFKITKTDKGFVELLLPHYTYPLRLLLTPYANEFRFKTYFSADNEENELRELLQQHWKNLNDLYCDDKGVNILVSHLFFAKVGEKLAEEPEDEKPITHIGGAQVIFSENLPENIQYVALGHLHRLQTIDQKPSPVVYSGSPLAYSFNEANQPKYIQIVDLEPKKSALLKPVVLEKGFPLIRKTFEDIDLCVQWLSDNPFCYVELTIRSDLFLTTEDQKRIQQAHDFIVTIIPETKQKKHTETESEISLHKNIQDLFVDFFKDKKGQEPSEELLSLFKEIFALDETIKE